MKFHRSRTAIIGVCCALAGAAVVPVVGLAGISGSTGDGPMVVQSGATSVTYLAMQNVASLPATSYKQFWTRVGDTVDVTGIIPLTTTSTGDTAVYIPLPVPSNLTSHFDCEGNATVGAPVQIPAKIQGSDTAGRLNYCIVNYQTTNTALQYIHYSMKYRVLD